MSSLSHLDALNDSATLQGALIPPTQLIDRIEADAVRWILVIEKEVSRAEERGWLSLMFPSTVQAVFQSLCCSAFLKEDERLKNGIIVTGKGYPDLSTRELVKRLSIALPLFVNPPPPRVRLQLTRF